MRRYTQGRMVAGCAAVLWLGAACPTPAEPGEESADAAVSTTDGDGGALQARDGGAGNSSSLAPVTSSSAGAPSSSGAGSSSSASVGSSSAALSSSSSGPAPSSATSSAPPVSSSSLGASSSAVAPSSSAVQSSSSSAPSCQDDCPGAGARECAGSGVRECGEYDRTDSCLEWSPVEDCPEGWSCDPASASCTEPCGDSCEPFSIVLLPDTQYYTNKQPNNSSNTYRKQARWVVEHRQTENVQFVIHLGDLTNNNLDAQWQVADDAHAILDAASMPYSVAPGNHDYLDNGVFSREGSLFNTYFGTSRFAGRPWFGGSYGSSNTNNFSLFDVGSLKFMVVNLEYAPRKDALCWAERQIAAHPDRRVILETHCYQTNGGGHAENCPDVDYAAVGGNGDVVWNELASRFSNIFLVVSGHVDDSEYRTRVGNTGNTVHEMMVDYQFEAACDAASATMCTDACRAGTYTGNGWMRQLVLDPRMGRVQAKTFTVESGNTALFPNGQPVFFCSPLYNPSDPNADGGNWYASDPAAAAHRFEFPLDLVTPPQGTREDLGKRAFNDRTVNSVGAGDQVAPRVAVSPLGAFVVAWEDDSSATDGTGNHDIKARGFAPGGCSAFADITVNTTTDGQQSTPDLAMDAAGNFLVAWADDSDGNGSFQVHARGFGPDGQPRISLFTVNTIAEGQQLHPAVAMAPDGNFVVAWEDDRAGDSHEQVWVRGFAANGTERFTARSVHADNVGRRVRPAVAMDGTGGFVVAWQDDSDGNGTFQVHARGFQADGTERFARKTVNSVADGQQRNPAVGMDGTGAFLVAWEDDQDGDGNFQVLARGFTASGVERLPDFRVHAATTGTHVAPAVSVAADGRFVVAWQDDGDGNGTWQVKAHAFRADGSAWRAEWTVNHVPDGTQRAPHVSVNAGGTLVSVWEDDMDGNGSFQLLAAGVDLP